MKKEFKKGLCYFALIILLLTLTSTSKSCEEINTGQARLAILSQSYNRRDYDRGLLWLEQILIYNRACLHELKSASFIKNCLVALAESDRFYKKYPAAQTACLKEIQKKQLASCETLFDTFSAHEIELYADSYLKWPPDCQKAFLKKKHILNYKAGPSLEYLGVCLPFNQKEQLSTKC